MNHALHGVSWWRQFLVGGSRPRRLRRGEGGPDGEGGRGVLKGRRGILEARGVGRSRVLLGLLRQRTERYDYCSCAQSVDGLEEWAMTLLLPLTLRVVVQDIVLRDP